MKQPAIITLRSVKVFEDLSDKALAEIAQISEMRSFRPNILILSQNAAAQSVAFIVSGFVKLMRGDRQAMPKSLNADATEYANKCVLVDLLGPGDTLGAASVLLGNGYSSSAISLTPCNLIFIRKDHFINLLYDVDGLSKKLMESLAKSLVESEKHAQLMNGDVKSRVFSIRDRCSKLGVDTERWLSNAEVARMSGATRVAVSQVMNHEKRLQKKTVLSPTTSID